jgi:hypothetical protein
MYPHAYASLYHPLFFDYYCEPLLQSNVRHPSFSPKRISILMFFGRLLRSRHEFLFDCKKKPKTIGVESVTRLLQYCLLAELRNSPRLIVGTQTVLAPSRQKTVLPQSVPADTPNPSRRTGSRLGTCKLCNSGDRRNWLHAALYLGLSQKYLLW